MADDMFISMGMLLLANILVETRNPWLF
jgi:hypothetical protein